MLCYQDVMAHRMTRTLLVNSTAICMECTAPPIDAFITCTICHKTKPRHCYSRVRNNRDLDFSLGFGLMLMIVWPLFSGRSVFLALMMHDAKGVSKSTKKGRPYKSRTLKIRLTMMISVMMACHEKHH